jgi:hypothetical protein
LKITLEYAIRKVEENQSEVKMSKLHKLVVYNDNDDDKDNLLGYNTNIFIFYCENHIKDTLCR